jgi:putative membrane protein
MLKGLILSWLVVATAIAIAAAVVPSVDVDGGVLSLLGVAFLFGLVNALVGPVLRLVSLPITLVTFGLFTLVVNGALLALTAGLSDALDVGGFLAAVGAALLISLLSALMTFGVGTFVERRPSA